MRRLSLALLLLVTAAPLSAQNPIDFANDPAGSKPNGWSPADDPRVSFEATGQAQLQMGDFGVFFPHALGASGNGYMIVRFTDPAIFFSAFHGGHAGSTVTFRSFLGGVFVGGWNATLSSPRMPIGFANNVGNDLLAPFDQLHIIRTHPGEAEHELIDDVSWAPASQFPQFTAPPSSTVPEPASMALLGTGLAGLVGAARRRRKRQQEGAE